jgi:hypothetical protein
MYILKRKKVIFLLMNFHPIWDEPLILVKVITPTVPLSKFSMQACILLTCSSKYRIMPWSGLFSHFKSDAAIGLFFNDVTQQYPGLIFENGLLVMAWR